MVHRLVPRLSHRQGLGTSLQTIVYSLEYFFYVEKKTVQFFRLLGRVLVQVRCVISVYTFQLSNSPCRHNPNHSGRDDISFEEIPFVKEEWAKKLVDAQISNRPINT